MAKGTDTDDVPTATRRLYDMRFGAVYPLYVDKAEKKGRTKREVDQVIRWLTGYSQRQVMAKAKQQTTLEQFFVEAPALNADRSLITGVVCGVRVEEVEHEVLREIRYLDKLVDELAKGKPMAKVLRSAR